MMQRTVKSLFFLVIFLICLASMLRTLIWSMVDNNTMAPLKPPRHKKQHPGPAELCEGCKVAIEKVKNVTSQTWKKNEYNFEKLRLQLKSQCNGSEKAIITQANTPLGSKIRYDGEQSRTHEVKLKTFNTFVKVRPFQRKTYETCAVVGNGGILRDSGCGEEINSAQFVIRCNLPPLDNGFEEDVGNKTDLVTANPS
ncbi:alpha-2,8-sialyltransferase 8E-like, partial [Plectropomus leopardus]|uniref:alpha-2,8-sialyltransferase 8E-like n=1 Tax=Plectropomus leopardus TaxID=160734 RepID=UPI001C4ABEAE